MTELTSKSQIRNLADGIYFPHSVNYLFLWLADGANVGTMQQAGSIVAMGLSWREASVAM